MTKIKKGDKVAVIFESSACHEIRRICTVMKVMRSKIEVRYNKTISGSRVVTFREVVNKSQVAYCHQCNALATMRFKQKEWCDPCFLKDELIPQRNTPPQPPIGESPIAEAQVYASKGMIGFCRKRRQK